jgi:transcriptional regulator with XRE-family HTH domain
MSETSHPVDRHVGARVRLRRTLMGLSQEKLGTALGLTFQQVQKYERGSNRISASKLYEMSHVLDVPVSFFFQDLADQTMNAVRGFADQAAEPFDHEQISRRETAELMRAYYQIGNAKVRRKMLDLMKSMAGAESGSSQIDEPQPGE